MTDDQMARKLTRLSRCFAFQTLHDGTLLDVEVTLDGIMILRAGKSLVPEERPEVLRLSFGDFGDLVGHAIPLFIRRVRERESRRARDCRGLSPRGRRTVIISGQWDVRTVLVDGRLLDPVPSQRLWNHSPDGFNWGYAGSGPAQLALALLLHVGVDEDRAVRLHQRLKADVIQHLPHGDFVVPLDIDAWVASQEDP